MLRQLYQSRGFLIELCCNTIISLVSVLGSLKLNFSFFNMWLFYLDDCYTRVYIESAVTSAHCTWLNRDVHDKTFHSDSRAKLASLYQGEKMVNGMKWLSRPFNNFFNDHIQLYHLHLPTSSARALNNIVAFEYAKRKVLLPQYHFAA